MAKEDIVFNLTELIASQTEYMWTAALGVTGTSALLCAFVMRQLTRTRAEKVSVVLLLVSILFNLASIAAGYVVKNAMILSMQEYAVSGEWAPDPTVEGANLFQSLFFFVGMILFLVAVLTSARTFAKAAKSVGGGK